MRCGDPEFVPGAVSVLEDFSVFAEFIGGVSDAFVRVEIVHSETGTVVVHTPNRLLHFPERHTIVYLSMRIADQPYQMCTSRRILSEWTGKDVRHFAYPAGEYNAAAFASLARCGYLSAYWKAGGSLQSADRMFLLYRQRVRGQQGLAALLSALAQ